MSSSPVRVKRPGAAGVLSLSKHASFDKLRTLVGMADTPVKTITSYEAICLKPRISSLAYGGSLL